MIKSGNRKGPAPARTGRSVPLLTHKKGREYYMRFDKRPSKKAKSGYTWRVTIEYKDRYGVNQKHTKSGFATKTEAKAYGLKVQDDLSNGLNVDAAGKTLDELFAEWKKLTTLRENSVRIYTSAYTGHIQPVLGRSKVAELGYIELQNFFNSISEVGSPTVKNTGKVLSQLNKFAIKAGYTRGWPLEAVEMKGKDTTRTRETEYLPKADFDRIINELSSGKYFFRSSSVAMFVYLGYYLGLRLSESLALKWEDFSSDYRDVRIHAQIIRGSKGITEDLKTAASKAILPVPAPLAEALKQWKEINPHPFICCNEDGSLLSVGTVESRIIGISKKLGIPFHAHMLRHTYITNLILSGADPKTAADLARHASPEMTLKVYTEISAQKKREAVNNAFSPELPDLKA